MTRNNVNKTRNDRFIMNTISFSSFLLHSVLYDGLIHRLQWIACLAPAHISYSSWVFGEFLCKMYQFVHALSYTASIFILMIICMERYFAIIFPITCKQILTPTRLRVSTYYPCLKRIVLNTQRIMLKNVLAFCFCFIFLFLDYNIDTMHYIFIVHA